MITKPEYPEFVDSEGASVRQWETRPSGPRTSGSEQDAAANPYPLRGRVEVTLSGSSPLPDSLPPYQGG